MSRFVDDCRKEWGRLGVPEVEANEMAADLEADLAEARADGVSPEEVLGNGYFDAKSFAASWAMARGVVDVAPRGRSTIPLGMALGAVAAAVVAGVGFLILVGPRFGSQAAAFSVPRRNNRPLPSIFVSPHHVFSAGPNAALGPLGLAFLLLGLFGFVAILWIWRPWSGRRQGTESDQNIGMPSFL